MRRCLLLLLALSLAATQTAHANDSAMGGHGGSLVPIEETRVEMVSEDIELTYATGQWQVRAHYVFRNATHERIALQMGFPETHCDGEGDCVMSEGDVFEQMRTLVRGKVVPRRKGKLSAKHAWAPKLGMVWLYDVTFAPNEELEIDHSYTTPSGVDVMGTQFTTYITRTGALWGRPIQRATFRVVLPAAARQLQEPTNVPRTNVERPTGPKGPLVLTYEARDWKPKEDFSIGFNERVDWHGRKPTGPLAEIRCDELWALYHAVESEGRLSTDDVDLPHDLESLRVCRNAVYAQHGRRFKDEALNQYFYGKDGFRADGPALLAFDPNPHYSDALLTPQDRTVLAVVRARESALAAPQEMPTPGPRDNGDENAPAAVTGAVTSESKDRLQKAVPPPQTATTRQGGSCGGCATGPTSSPTAALLSWVLVILARRRSWKPC